MHIFFQLILFNLVRAQSDQCAAHQVWNNNQCQECSAMQFGCRQCSVQTGKDVIGLSNAKVIQCDACDYGFYLLSFDDKAGQNNLKNRINACVPNCGDFAPNYVGNPNTMKCEYCGPDCTHCTLQYGCSTCIGPNRLQNVTVGYPVKTFPYSKKSPSKEFRTCIDCKSVDERCSICDNHSKFNQKPTRPYPLAETAGQHFCDKCPNYIQSAAEQQKNGNWCVLQDTKIQNCLQGDPQNPKRCYVCKDGYQVDMRIEGNDTISECVPCNIDNCQRCSRLTTQAKELLAIEQENANKNKNTTTATATAADAQQVQQAVPLVVTLQRNVCEKCKPGFVLTNGQCVKCNLDKENNDLYEMIKPRCTECTQDTTKCHHCNIGFMRDKSIYAIDYLGIFKQRNLLKSGYEDYPASEICRLRCHTNEFPFAEYELVNGEMQLKKHGKHCKQCPSSCTRCKNPGNSKPEDSCLECEQDKYLQITDKKSGAGKCLNKQGTANDMDIFVSNLIDETKVPARQRSGTYDDPFAQLSDAIAKAKDDAAPFKFNVKVKIHMFKGEHYMIEHRGDAINHYFPNTGHDPFQLNVEIEILPLSCQLKNQESLGIKGQIPESICGGRVTLINKIRERFKMPVLAKLNMTDIIIDSTDSLLPYGTKCLSEYKQCCKMVNGVPTGQNGDCKKHYDQLKLTDNCQFAEWRTMFDFVANNDYGVYPLFKNNRLVLRRTDIRNVFYSMNSLFNITKHGAQVDIVNSTIEDINICGSLLKNHYNHKIKKMPEVDQSTRFHNQKISDFSQKMLLVHEIYFKLKPDFAKTWDQSVLYIEGSTLRNLNHGSKQINNSEFESRMSSDIYSHALIMDLHNFPGEVVIKSSSITNNQFKFEDCGKLGNIDFSEPDSSLGVQPNKKVQIKSLVSVMQHENRLAFIDSTFINNTGTKGILNLEKQQNGKGFLLYGNRFINNSGLIDSNIVSFRTEVKDAGLLFAKNYSDIKNLQCGGLSMRNNNFTNNWGCKYTNGVLYGYCYSKSVDSQGRLKYDKQVDTQYFTAKDLFDPSLVDQAPEKIIARSTEDVQIANYGRHANRGQFREDFISSNFYIHLEGNNYTDNGMGKSRSVVKLEGMNLVVSKSELYLRNQNWFAFLQNRKSQIRVKIDNSYSDQFTQTIDEKFLIDYKYRSQAVLSAKRLVYAQILKSVFDSNWIIDDLDPGIPQSKDIQLQQSQTVLLQDFSGSLVLSSAVFKNVKGILVDEELGKRLDSKYDKHGFKQHVVNINRGKFHKLGLQKVSFEDSLGYNYVLAPGQVVHTSRPQFIAINSESFFDFDEKFSIDMRGMSIKRTRLLNVDNYIEFFKHTQNYEGFEFIDNGGNPPTANETHECFVKFDYSRNTTISISNWKVSDNRLKNATFIKFNLTETEAEKNVTPILATINIKKGSLFHNNTSTRRAALFELEDMYWMRLRIADSQLSNNYGTVVNDMYLRNIKRLTFIRSTWSQNFSVLKNNTFKDNSQGIDLREYDKANPNFLGRNTAKFLLQNEEMGGLELNFYQSTIDCKMHYARDSIMSKTQENGMQPVIKISLPFDKSRPFLSVRNESAYGLGIDVLDPYWNSLKCSLNKNKTYTCYEGMSKWQFLDATFQNCHNGIKGSIFHLSNGAGVNITGRKSQAHNNSAHQGGFAYMIGRGTKMFVKPSNTRGGQFTQFTFSGQNGYQGGAFYLIDHANVTFSKVKFSKGEVYQGLIYMQNKVQIEMKAVNFTQNLAYYQGLIYARWYSFMDVQETYFWANEGVNDAACVYIDGPPFLSYYNQQRATQLGIKDSQGFYNNIFSFDRSTQVSKFDNIRLYKNKMKYGGALFKIINSNIVVSNSRFYLNYMYNKYGGLHLVNAGLNLTNSFLDGNMFQPGRPKSFFENPEISELHRTVTGGFITVSDNSSLISVKNNYLNNRASYGGCVAIVGRGKASFLNDTFTKCQANIGGAIFAEDISGITGTNLKFVNNTAYSDIAESVYAKRFADAINLTNVNITGIKSNSISMEEGFDIYFKNVKIGNPTNWDKRKALINFNIKQLIESRKLLKGVSISVVTFKNGSQYFKFVEPNPENKYINITTYIPKLKNHKLKLPGVVGGGIALKNMKYISTFEKIEMFNLIADHGGCLYIGLDDNFRHIGYNPSMYNIQKVQMNGCIANKNGGGFYIENIKNMTIKELHMNNNTAEKAGGGIYFGCANKITNCDLYLDQSSNIMFNKAGLQGGGIYWDYKPHFAPPGQKAKASDEWRIFHENVATYYGNQNASKAVRILIFKTLVNSEGRPIAGKKASDTFNKYVKPKSEWKRAEGPIPKELASYETQFNISKVQSGGNIPTQYCGIVDVYGQVVVPSTGAMVYINNMTAQKIFLYGRLQFFSANGVFMFSNIEIVTLPGKTGIIIPLWATDSAINTHPAEEYRLNLNIAVQACQRGQEQIKKGENYICNTCPQGQFLLALPETNVTSTCLECKHEQSICSGGMKIGPRKGWWRKSNRTDVFNKCFGDGSNCLGLYHDVGIVKRKYRATGWCKEGTYGAFCASCKPRWSMTGTFVCSPCDSHELTLLKCFGMLTLMLLVCAGLVVSTLNGSTQRQTHTVFIKIFLNHMQMLVIVMTFKMEWPAYITALFKAISIVFELTRMIVAFDCVMDQRPASAAEDAKLLNQFVAQPGEWRITYYKLLIWFSLPVICCIGSFISWFFIYWREKGGSITQVYTPELFSRFLSTLIVLLFLVHPLATQFFIDMFDCTDYDGQFRLNYDPQILCFQGLHQDLAFGVALPGFIIWGLGIPYAIYKMMAKEEKDLDTEDVKVMFGFLYQGYKLDVYFWEVIIMYRKIICLLIATLMAPLGIFTQATLLIVVLVICLNVNAANRPYINRSLNDTEDLSILANLITVYCGLFFEPNKPRKTDSEAEKMKKNVTINLLFITILVVNVMFVVQWLVNFVASVKQMIKDTQSLHSYYVCIFLCGRHDQIPNDQVKSAQHEKREKIMETIEETQHFFKKMMGMYEKQINYQDHQKFIQLLQYIEVEKGRIDLSIIPHNLFIQGETEKHRKFDKDKLAKAQDIDSLEIDVDRGGLDLKMKVINEDCEVQDFNKSKKSKVEPINIEKYQLMPEEENANFLDANMIGQGLIHHRNITQDLGSNDLTASSKGGRIDPSQFPFGRPNLTRKISVEEADTFDRVNSFDETKDKLLLNTIKSNTDLKMMKNDSAKFGGNLDKSDVLASTISQKITQVKKELTIQEPTIRDASQDNQSQAPVKNKKKKDIIDNGLESDVEEDDKKKKKEQKIPNIKDIGEDIKKSRNMASRVKKTRKERIFAKQYDDDPDQLTRPVMREKFKCFDILKEKSEHDSDPDSPVKEPSPLKDIQPNKDLEDDYAPDQVAIVIEEKDIKIESPRPTKKDPAYDEILDDYAEQEQVKSPQGPLSSGDEEIDAKKALQNKAKGLLVQTKNALVHEHDDSSSSQALGEVKSHDSVEYGKVFEESEQIIDFADEQDEDEDQKQIKREKTHLEYKMVVGELGAMEIKTIEKPVIKKKLYQWVKNDETGEAEKADVSRDSDMLQLSILGEEDNMDEVQFNVRTKQQF